MCIRGRNANQIWFSKEYPKTGGGEDVDFCLRVKDLEPYHSRNEAIVSVPEAKAKHPFWDDILKQVMGWASGDVKCLSNLPQKYTFYTTPNWIEFIFFMAVCNIHNYVFMANVYSLYWLWKVSYSVLLIELFLTSTLAYPHTSKISAYPKRIVITFMAALPVISQDVVRFFSKLSRGVVVHLCLHFDWMDGQRDHKAVYKTGQFIKTFIFSLWAVALSLPSNGGGCYCFVILDILLISYFTQSQYFSRGVEQAEFISQLTPLPMDFEEEDPQPFVILTFQRTGSNLLCGKLHSHSEIIMHNEIFNSAKIWTYQTEDIQNDPSFRWNTVSRAENPAGFLDDIYHRKSLKKNHCKAVGFKLFPDHWNDTNDKVLKIILADKRVKKIILRRENYLDVYASKLRSDKSGDYVGKSLDDIPIWIDSSSFQGFLEYYDKCYEYYDTLVQDQDVLRVSYEDLTCAEKEGDQIRKILKFLNVDSSFIPATLKETKKQTKVPLSEGGLVNYRDVKAAFKLHPKMKKFL